MRKLWIVLAFFTLINANEFSTTQLSHATTSQWQDMNSTIQEYIINSQQMIEKKLIPKLSTPYKPLTQKQKDSFQIPKLLYTRNDLQVAMGYIKYLLHQKQNDKVSDLYIQAIMGLNQRDEDYMMITLIYHIAMNDIILHALQHDIALLSVDNRQKILNKAPNLFELTVNDCNQAWKNDIRINSQYIETLLQKFLPTHDAKSIAAALLTRTHTFYDKLFALATMQEQNQIMQSIQQKKVEFAKANREKLEFLNQKLTKNAKSFQPFLYIDDQIVETPKKQTLDNTFVIDALFYYHFVMEIVQSNQDCLNVIKLNQKVVELLKSGVREEL